MGRPDAYTLIVNQNPFRKKGGLFWCPRFDEFREQNWG